MEPRVVKILGLLAIPVLWVGVVLAEPPPEGGPGGPEGPGPGQGPKEGGRPPGGMRRLMPFKPFLMAGSPQFAQMLKISLLPPDKVEAEMQNWPKFQEMDEPAREEFRKGIDQFRRRIREDALNGAREQKITIPPARETEYVRLYWEKRIQIETRIRQQAEGQLKQDMDTAFRDLRQRFPSPAATP